MTDGSVVLEDQENQQSRDLLLGTTGEFLHTSGCGKAERKTDRQAEQRGLHTQLHAAPHHSRGTAWFKSCVKPSASRASVASHLLRLEPNVL